MTERIGSPTGFTLAMVSDDDYQANPMCAHCLSDNADEHRVLLFIETKDVTADVMKCSECNNPYLVIQKPILEEDMDEIYLKFKLV